MDQHHRVIWHEASGTYAVVSEKTKARGKKRTKTMLIAICSALMLLISPLLGQCP